MKMKSTGLGKGLNAIFDTQEQSNSLNVGAGSIVEIELARIKPNPTQPRTMFEQDSLQELSSSITRLGVIQPITVRETGVGEYMIISGERRYRASQMAGLTTIPTYVRSADNDQVLEMALVENIQRQDLNAMEIAITMQRLMEECNLTQESLSERVGKKRSTVANYIRLLKLPAEVQVAIAGDVISMGHARALVAVERGEVQLEILEKIVEQSLSVRQVEQLVAELAEAATVPFSGSIAPISQSRKRRGAGAMGSMGRDYTVLVERLERYVGPNISIKQGLRGNEHGGQIVIRFNSQEDIDRILENLSK